MAIPPCKSADFQNSEQIIVSAKAAYSSHQKEYLDQIKEQLVELGKELNCLLTFEPVVVTAEELNIISVNSLRRRRSNVEEGKEIEKKPILTEELTDLENQLTKLRSQFAKTEEIELPEDLFSRSSLTQDSEEWKQQVIRQVQDLLAERNRQVAIARSTRACYETARAQLQHYLTCPSPSTSGRRMRRLPSGIQY